MKFLYILAVCIGLSGCASWWKKPDAIISEKVVDVHPSVLLPCDDLILPSGNDFNSILEVSILNAEIYFNCRNKQDISIKLIKEFANIK